MRQRAVAACECGYADYAVRVFPAFPWVRPLFGFEQRGSGDGLRWGDLPLEVDGQERVRSIRAGEYEVRIAPRDDFQK